MGKRALNPRPPADVPVPSRPATPRFTPWLVFMAPRVADGAPLWNTVRRGAARAGGARSGSCAAAGGSGGRAAASKPAPRPTSPPPLPPPPRPCARPQTFLYLSAAVPNHLYKAVACYYKPAWYPWLMGPAIYTHWIILVTSMVYYLTECSRTTWGCWYPGSIMMLGGEGAGAGVGSESWVCSRRRRRPEARGCGGRVAAVQRQDPQTWPPPRLVCPAGAWFMAVWDVPSFLTTVVGVTS
jgi:hypothetical protein